MRVCVCACVRVCARARVCVCVCVCVCVRSAGRWPSQGFGFGGTGRKSNNRKFEAYGEAFGNGDVVGCFLDRDAGEVSFRSVSASVPAAPACSCALNLSLRCAAQQEREGVGRCLQHR